MDDLLPPHGVEPVVFARMTGIPLRRLRHYDRRGLFPAGQVDPRTGRRRYDPGQVSQGRLLQALHATGMDVEQAVSVAREGRRTAALDHLAQVEEHLAVAREHLPPPGEDVVRTRDVAAEPVLAMEVAAEHDVLEVVRAARRDLASAMGTTVDALPRRAPGDDLPDGAWVELEVEEGGRVLPRRVLAPTVAGAEAPPGWAPATREGGVHGVLDLEAPQSLLLPAALGVLREWIDGPAGGYPLRHLLALDGDVVCASLLVRIVPMRTRPWWA